MYRFRKDLQHKEAVKISVPHQEVMMCLNENPLNPYPELKEEFQQILTEVPFNRYFNEVTQKLQELLSNYIEIGGDCIAMGNGADEMLYYLFTSLNAPESYILSLAPSYFDYKSYSSAVGMSCRFLHLDQNYNFKADEFLQLLQPVNCKLGIICNPNNPTGNLFAAEKIIYIIENTDKLILVDEAYFEFAGETLLDYVHKYPNLIILRTFSKSFASAGLRFGYLVSNPENITEIKKVITAFNLSLVTQAFALVILRNKEIFLQNIVTLIKEREYIYSRLSQIDEIEPIKSYTNFITFTAGNKTKKLFKYLQTNGIALRAVWQHPVLEDHVRVTVSRKKDNKLFLQKVKEFIQT
ncbi:MAG: histidinol-phosphate aminotransferase family protein [Candidatus Cloacimonetes bacterium]|nr:histidinol-phosphate aminotransferase family protein [Candidatus Cloacimonadota bacterium]